MSIPSIGTFVSDLKPEMSIPNITTIVSDLKPEMSIPNISTIVSDLKPEIPEKAIEMQAALYNAMWEGKSWAAESESLTRINGSKNWVYKLNKCHEPEVAAFFKVGAGNENASGKMEKLMWDMAVLLGYEENFAPTGETEVRTKQELAGGQQKLWRWDKGNLIEVKGAKKGMHGSIQVAQKGNLLYKVEDLSKEEIVKGILISVLFGMSDAHNMNILVTEEGKIKFFDNTRSMPNGNGYIDWSGNDICSAYRCALLDLPSASKPLDNVDIESLKKEVAILQQNLPKLWAFLNTPQTKAMLKTLPPGWMDIAASFEAMKERVHLLDEALSQGRIKTAQDLAGESCPGYKFAFAVTYLHQWYYAPNNFEPEHAHNCTGYDSMNAILEELESMGFDFKQLKEWCDTLSLADLTNKIQNNSLTLLSRDPSVLAKSKAIKNQILNSAVINFKDLRRKDCEKVVSDLRKRLTPKRAEEKQPVKIPIRDM